MIPCIQVLNGRLPLCHRGPMTCVDKSSYYFIVMPFKFHVFTVSIQFRQHEKQSQKNMIIISIFRLLLVRSHFAKRISRSKPTAEKPRWPTLTCDTEAITHVTPQFDLY